MVYTGTRSEIGVYSLKGLSGWLVHGFAPSQLIKNRFLELSRKKVISFDSLLLIKVGMRLVKVHVKGHRLNC